MAFCISLDRLVILTKRAGKLSGSARTHWNANRSVQPWSTQACRAISERFSFHAASWQACGCKLAVASWQGPRGDPRYRYGAHTHKTCQTGAIKRPVGAPAAAGCQQAACRSGVPDGTQKNGARAVDGAPVIRGSTEAACSEIPLREGGHERGHEEVTR